MQIYKVYLENICKTHLLMRKSQVQGRCIQQTIELGFKSNLTKEYLKILYASLADFEMNLRYNSKIEIQVC